MRLLCKQSGYRIERRVPQRMLKKTTPVIEGLRAVLLAGFLVWLAEGRFDGPAHNTPKVVPAVRAGDVWVHRLLQSDPHPLTQLPFGDIDPRCTRGVKMARCVTPVRPPAQVRREPRAPVRSTFQPGAADTTNRLPQGAELAPTRCYTIAASFKETIKAGEIRVAPERTMRGTVIAFNPLLQPASGYAPSGSPITAETTVP